MTTSCEPQPAAAMPTRYPVVHGVRIAVVQGVGPEDWRGIYDRLDRGAKPLASLLVKLVAAGAAISVMILASLGLFLGIRQATSDISPYCLAGAALLPGLLCGAAAGQMAGNKFLRLWFRLDDAARRGFATRLSLGRCPSEWPVHLKRWLFTGDWLGSPSYDLRLPYVHIYIDGETPATCRAEDALWREIHGAISGDSLWEAGTNIREISYPRELPAWARQVENGDGFADLQKRIGAAQASEWVMHIWRRACRQWPVLAASDYPEQARKECFEMHSVQIGGGRAALVVVLRPHAFVAELENQRQGNDCLAA